MIFVCAEPCSTRNGTLRGYHNKRPFAQYSRISTQHSTKNTHLRGGLGRGLQVLEVIVVRRGLQLADPALLSQRLVDCGLGGLAQSAGLDGSGDTYAQ